MSQSSPTIANADGATVRGNINAALAAIVSSHKAGSAPSYAVAGTHWVDDSGTPWLWKIFDGADWISFASINPTSNEVILSAVDTDTTLAANSDIRLASQKAVKAYADSVAADAAADSVPLLYLDTDITLSANSDTKVPTQKAVKAYVDAQSGGGGGTSGYNEIVNALRIQAAVSSYALLYRGAADSFNDQTGVAANTGMVYDSTNKLFSNSGDSNWASVVSLRHMNNSAADAKGILTWSDANVTYSSTVYKFGGYSAYFNGTSAYLSVASPGTSGQFGTGEFTIRFWIRPDSGYTSGIRVLFDTRASDGSSAGFVLYTAGTTGYLVASTGSAAIVSTTTAPAADVWSLVSVSRKSGTMYVHLDGTLIGSAASSHNFTDSLFVMSRNSSLAQFYFKGYVDDFYVVKGTGVYSAASYSVPTSEAPDGSSGGVGSLTSVSFTAVSAPSEVSVLMLYQDVDSAGITLNSEVSFEISRDGGTTWSSAVLSDGGAFDSVSRMATAVVDVSGQPTGTSVKGKLSVNTSDRVNLLGYGILWS